MALPIEAALPALAAALAAHPAAVLQAPPGAGKTTRVPVALLDAPWLAGRRIVMLEPRRLAARAAARWMAHQLGEGVGDTVGYRVRLDTQVSARTRVEVVTEGVLTRMLQEDPALEDAALVIFDEFHERSLVADAGLALALHSQALLRPDLRLLVMSATLDGGPVAALLGGAPVVSSEGRAWPVETRHRPPRRDQRLDTAVAGTVLEALAAGPGDVLVFLPGAREIRWVADALAARADDLPAGTRVLPLHGTMTAAEQDAAIAPSPPGRRKVVLATAIAETSLTIEGVRTVVDAGLMRVPRFSPSTGMSRLETVRVTRDAADQRRGRAGRTAPGACYRLWAAAEEAGLLPQRTPEILDADLAPLALDLAAAGVADPAELRWLTPPPAAAFAHARELLGLLGALDAAGRLTPHGRAMARLPTHPRLAHMLLSARALGAGRMACAVAALLEDRDPLRGLAGPPDPDLHLRLEALEGRPVAGHEVDRGALERARREAAHLRSALERAGAGVPTAGSAPGGDGSLGLLLALAYPDRVAQRRRDQPGRFLLRNGRGAALPRHASLAQADYVVVAALDDAGAEGTIQLAAAVELAELEPHLGAAIEREEVVAWDAAAGAVLARRRTRLGAIVLRDAPLPDPDPGAVTSALLAGLAAEGVDRLPWSDGAVRVRQRLGFLHRLDPAWPDVSDAALATSLPDWLGPHVAGLRRREEVARLDLAALLLGLVPWPQRARLDELAPDRIEVPSGSRIAVDYTDPAAPVLAVRLQEVFGWEAAPAIGGGRVPLTLHLLSPAFRPVQVTRDLAGFWRGTYFEVRKDLRGRYPKHHWPDDPLGAPAVRGAKRRG